MKNTILCLLLAFLCPAIIHTRNGNTTLPVLTKNNLSNVYIDKSVLNTGIIPVSNKHTLQLITHGHPGQLLIDGKWRNAEEITSYVLSHSLITPAINHINIYGCEFAKGEVGLNAVRYLEQKLNVSVSASTNITGKDGDWILETGKNTDVISLPGYNGNLQCSYGTLYNTQYATASSGGLTGPTYGIGAPDGNGVAVYTTSATYDGNFTYANTFTAGADIIITAKYATASYPGGITVQFSVDNSIWTAASTVINGFTTSFTNVTYTVPGSLTAAYKYIKVHGNAANTWMPIDAIQVSTAYCNTCPSGLNAPVLSSTYIMLPCAASTVDLTTITASNSPANTTLTWHTGTPATNANKVATPSTASKSTSTYYAAFYNAANDCYSGPSGDGTACTAVSVDQYSDCFAIQCVNVNNAPWNKNTSVANNIIYNDGTQTRLANAASSNARIANATAVNYSTAVDTVATILPPAIGVRPVTVPIGQAQTLSAIYATPNATPASNTQEWILGWGYSKTFTGAAATTTSATANTIATWLAQWAANVKVNYNGISSTVTLYGSNSVNTIFYTGSILAGDSIAISLIPKSDGTAIVQGLIYRSSTKILLGQGTILTGLYANEAAYPLYPSISIFLGATNVGCIKVVTQPIPTAPFTGVSGTGVSSPWQVNSTNATYTILNDGTQTRLALTSNGARVTNNFPLDYKETLVNQNAIHLSSGDTSVLAITFLAQDAAGTPQQRWAQGWAFTPTFSGLSPNGLSTTVNTANWATNIYIQGNILYTYTDDGSLRTVYSNLLPGDQITGKLYRAASGTGADLQVYLYRPSISQIVAESYFPNAITNNTSAFHDLYAAVAIGDGETNLVSIGSSVSTLSTLPVKLISFSGVLQNSVAKLKWRTGIEDNFKHFELEKSTDGQTYTKAANIAAKGSESTYDHNLTQGEEKAFYRLKIVDNDGKFVYSNILLLSQSINTTGLQLYPNPAKDYIVINVNETAVIRIYDVSGRLEKTTQVQKGANTIDISSLSKGIHLCELNGEHSKFVKL